MKNRVFIRGIGAVPVGEHWTQSLTTLGAEAVNLALQDAQASGADAIVVGNMLSGVLNQQENLGAIIAQRAGLGNVEAYKVEAACASGAAALRVGHALVKSGECRRVLVVGVEKMTDAHPFRATEALSYAADFEQETVHGATFPALGALLTSLYLAMTEATEETLFRFSSHAHQKAGASSLSMFKHPITFQDWSRSPSVASPLRQLDCAPICDGAAAVLLEGAGESLPENPADCIEILALQGAIEGTPLAQRKTPLQFLAVKESVQKALQQAEIPLSRIDLFELHDAFPVVAAISLESAGFLPSGKGWKYFDEARQSCPAIQSMGGLKGRGHPVGATGVYQVVEACLQLRNQAGKCQIPDLQYAMTQSLGGLASNVFTTILRKAQS